MFKTGPGGNQALAGPLTCTGTTWNSPDGNPLAANMVTSPLAYVTQGAGKQMSRLIPLFLLFIPFADACIPTKTPEPGIPATTANPSKVKVHQHCSRCKKDNVG
ncbi:hypothetical protein PRIPAC_78165 [Pristionchus pacificus]|uniref:Uncharacterized protein n=1 Tax=Pristionchus pacificus TaxID=54126 RepID=A0A2A6CL16_PRIPA|nr:hypothetical protein PRIPAC_77718 [Pristionchus pacificus]KAF8371736.1 hypothetical protein PRIPAC_78165 [Pristionchus pacificus]|eukprot:PDM78345.1 hypothetical protein PRIPAC_30924 [Pristionchus pacificus]